MSWRITSGFTTGKKPYPAHIPDVPTCPRIRIKPLCMRKITSWQLVRYAVISQEGTRCHVTWELMALERYIAVILTFKSIEAPIRISKQSRVAFKCVFFLLQHSFICDVCQKGFNNRHSFRDHQNIHTGAKPHKCTHCPAAFASIGTARGHIRAVHEGKKRNSAKI